MGRKDYDKWSTTNNNKKKKKKKKKGYTPQNYQDPVDASPVKAKKHLGQHFLKDENIAKRIAETLSFRGYKNVIEVGPGTGVLTKYILTHEVNLVAMDLDRESIAYLNEQFPLLHQKTTNPKANFTVLESDFLKFDLASLFSGQPFAITGNFPYNISTQIVFKMLDYKEQIPEFTGMFQKEVAKRICVSEGSKAYGILSVLVQTYYDAEYLFTVHPQVFDPPPKVQSGVLRLVRKKEQASDFDPKLLKTLVKTAFNQRRKTLRNSLKGMDLPLELTEQPLFSKRPEQLSVTDFITLTQEVALLIN